MVLTVRGPWMSSAGLRASETSSERSLSRLSSGLRITRAADDAAGLAISTRLRSQAAGSAIAARNVQDGIGLLQTAEGGLTSITSMLQRVRDLAVQAASTGSAGAASRAAIAAETRQLVAEIDRTARGTASNGIRMLDGSRAGGVVFQVGADAGDSLSVATSDVRAEALGLLGQPEVVTTAALSGALTGSAPAPTYTTTSDWISGYDATGGKKLRVSLDGGVTTTKVDLDGVYASAQAVADAFSAALATTGVRLTVEAGTGTDGRLVMRSEPATTALIVSGRDGADLGFTTEEDAVEPDSSATTTATAETTTTTPATASLADLIAAGSSDAITRCDEALATVLSCRSDLGATQNRMEHRLSILAITGENLTAARSRIEDADMAQEYADLVRAQVLTQAGTALQAQGGQRGQRVLQLLSAL